MTRLTIDPDTATDLELMPLLAMGSIENVRDVLRHMAANQSVRPTEAERTNDLLERLQRAGAHR